MYSIKKTVYLAMSGFFTPRLKVSKSLAAVSLHADYLQFRGTQRHFLENVCSEDDLRSRIFGTFVVKFLASLPLLGFSNI